MLDEKKNIPNGNGFTGGDHLSRGDLVEGAN